MHVHFFSLCTDEIRARVESLGTLSWIHSKQRRKLITKHRCGMRPCSWWLSISCATVELREWKNVENAATMPTDGSSALHCIEIKSLDKKLVAWCLLPVAACMPADAHNQKYVFLCSWRCRSPQIDYCKLESNWKKNKFIFGFFDFRNRHNDWLRQQRASTWKMLVLTLCVCV